MQTQTEAIHMITDFGPLFVSVTQAKAETHYDVDQRRDVAVLRPRLYVASDPAFEADPDADDHWLIRRRRYGVLRLYNFRDLTHLEYADGRRGDRWHAENNPNRGGYRNDRRGQVEFQTTTWNQMNAAVLMALEAFAEMFPQWGELSLYLLAKAEEESNDLEISRVRAELSKLADRAASCALATVAAGERTPDDLLALVKD